MSGTNEREDVVKQIMDRILTGKHPVPPAEQRPSDPSREVQERIRQREQEAQGDPLPPRSKGGGHG